MMKWLRITAAIVALIGLLWFLTPMARGIVNIGNLTGAAVCALLAAYLFWMGAAHRLIARLWQPAIGKIVLGALGFAAAAALVLAVVISGFMIHAATRAPKGEATVVVLGCQVHGSNASLMLRERLDAALVYLNDHPDAPCVVSGGQGNGEDISEAECMYRYLVKNGIDPARIYKEERSTSTRENLAFSDEIIKANDLPQDLAVVTNEFHEYRARQIAHALGLSHSAVSAETAPWLFPTFYVRELYGILYEWLF